jgi:hypothetical protein
LNRSAPHGKDRVLLTCFPALVTIFVISGIYDDAWRAYAPACTFWLSAGLVWQQYESHPNRSVRNQRRINVVEARPQSINREVESDLLIKRD